MKYYVRNSYCAGRCRNKKEREALKIMRHFDGILITEPARPRDLADTLDNDMDGLNQQYRGKNLYVSIHGVENEDCAIVISNAAGDSVCSLSVLKIKAEVDDFSEFEEGGEE